jgi:hypothetical protein
MASLGVLRRRTLRCLDKSFAWVSFLVCVGEKGVGIRWCNKFLVGFLFGVCFVGVGMSGSGLGGKG